jgi:sister-chromatid-cohesion protein PDS5
MPSRSQSQSQALSQSQQQQQPDQQRLTFSSSLRSTTHTELVKRLKQLHQELRDFDQDLVDTASLDTVAKDLIHPSLLLHKDKGVKAYVGACLVDILRLYAPDAPYTPAELKVSASVPLGCVR